jgi:hypothetical protein
VRWQRTFREIQRAANVLEKHENMIQPSGCTAKKKLSPWKFSYEYRCRADFRCDGRVFLDWKAPVDGGRVSAYKMQRRQRPEGAWQNVATAILSACRDAQAGETDLSACGPVCEQNRSGRHAQAEATLVAQPKGKELEYRIIAINKAGEGEASNTAMVVL